MLDYSKKWKNKDRIPFFCFHFVGKFYETINSDWGEFLENLKSPKVFGENFDQNI